MSLPDAWRRRTIWAAFGAAAARWPDREALVAVEAGGTTTRVTHAALAARAQRLAAGFHELGLRRGDRLSLWMTNRVDMVAVFYGAMRLGVHVAPMSTWLRPDEAAAELANARSRCLVLVDLRGGPGAVQGAATGRARGGAPRPARHVEGRPRAARRPCPGAGRGAGVTTTG